MHDHADRLWVGNRTSGLSCFDNDTWTHYGVLDGLGGTRVFDIVADPASHTLYVATENGVTELAPKDEGGRLRDEAGGTTTANAAGARFVVPPSGGWSLPLADGSKDTSRTPFVSYTHHHGLPADEIAALAIAPDGILWAAGACGGLRYLDGGSWQRRDCDAPLEAVLCNDLLVLADGTKVLAATDGLYIQQPAETKWQHWRPTKLLPKHAKEDYITCVGGGGPTATENVGGGVPTATVIHCGTRKSGLISFHPDSSRWSIIPKGKKPDGLPDTFVSAILPLKDGRLAVGTYGGGYVVLSPKKSAASGQAPFVVRDAVRPPGADERSAVIPSERNSVGRPAGRHALLTTNEGVTTTVSSDWQTQGDWIGRYGTYAWILPAMGLPHDFSGGPGIRDIQWHAYMGDNHSEGDSLRYWTYWKQTGNPKSLRNPFARSRRQSSWDDAGELYPPDHDGPHVFIDMTLPEGDFMVSLYFVNIDCLGGFPQWRTHDGFPLPNRFRDYLVEMTQQSGRRPPDGDRSSSSLILPPSSLSPRLRTRVRDFASGVYKRFPLAGSATYTIKIDRNHSHNTILSGLFIDRIDPIVGRTSTAASSPIVGPMSTAAMPLLCSSRPWTAEPLSALIPLYGSLLVAGYTRDAATIATRIAESAASLPLPEHEALVLDFWRAHQIPHPDGFRRFGHEPCPDGITLAKALVGRMSTAASLPGPSSRPWTSEPLSEPLTRLRALAVRCSHRRELTPLATVFWQQIARSAKDSDLTGCEALTKGLVWLRAGHHQGALNLFRLAARKPGPHQPEAREYAAFAKSHIAREERLPAEKDRPEQSQERRPE